MYLSLTVVQRGLPFGQGIQDGQQLVVSALLQSAPSLTDLHLSKLALSPSALSRLLSMPKLRTLNVCACQLVIQEGQRELNEEDMVLVEMKRDIRLPLQSLLLPTTSHWTPAMIALLQTFCSQPDAAQRSDGDATVPGQLRYLAVSHGLVLTTVTSWLGA